MKSAHSLAATVLALGLASASHMAQAGGVAFQFGEDTFGVSLATELSADSSAQLDWLHHEDGGDMAAAGVFANGQRGSLSGRLGAKLVGVDDDDSGFDGGALAFGGDLGLPLNDVLRLRAGLYYAPETTGFGDVEGYTEFSTSVEISIFQNSAIQLGYADYEFDADPGEFEFEDGLFIRLQLRL